MAWMPGAIKKEVTKHRTAITGPRRLVLHTAVSASQSLFNYFNADSTSVCSHFYVRADGTIEQYVSTAYRAPANLQANPDSVSVESQDMGTGFPLWLGENVPPWTDAQVKALAEIASWCHATHGINLSLLPDSRAGRNGVGYHRLGIDPWRVEDGQLWSNSYGKVCPGEQRIKQVPSVISLAKQTDPGGGGTLPGKEEDDVNLTDKISYTDAVGNPKETTVGGALGAATNVWSLMNLAGLKFGDISYNDVQGAPQETTLGGALGAATNVWSRLGELEAKVDAILAAVSPPSG